IWVARTSSRKTHTSRRPLQIRSFHCLWGQARQRQVHHARHDVVIRALHDSHCRYGRCIRTRRDQTRSAALRVQLRRTRMSKPAHTESTGSGQDQAQPCTMAGGSMLCMQGQGIVKGFAIGRAAIMSAAALEVDHYRILDEDVDAECERLVAAVERAK